MDTVLRLTSGSFKKAVVVAVLQQSELCSLEGSVYNDTVLEGVVRAIDRLTAEVCRGLYAFVPVGSLVRPPIPTKQTSFTSAVIGCDAPSDLGNQV